MSFSGSPEGSEKPLLTIDLHDGRNEQVSIIVVHHKRPEHLSICLQSIYLMSHMNNYEVIVVDNNSGDKDSIDYLHAIEQEGVQVIINHENAFWSAAANQGAAVADKLSKYLFFMHADTVVLQNNWIDMMIQVSEAKGCGLVGHKISRYYVNNQKYDFVNEWCMMITRQCWNDIGPWPEELPFIGHSFIMNVRANMLGYKPVSLGGGIVHHYQAPSYDPSDYEMMEEKSKAIIPKLMHAAQL